MKDGIVAGDSLDFVTSVPAYPASAGYTLKYRLVPTVTGSGAVITLTATASGDDYRVTVAPSATANWVPAEYSEAAWVEKTGERHTVDGAFLPFNPMRGVCRILPDPATATSFDGRSTAQRALDEAEAALANFNATGGRVRRYAIAGREIEFDGASELVKLVNYWTNEVRLENAAKADASGQPDPRRVHVRMSNA